MSINDTLAERGERYGDYKDHARITQSIKVVMKSGIGWAKATDSEKEALEMIAHKIGRIVNGDPHYHDSWTDIAGYAILVANKLLKLSETQNEPIN